MKLLGGNKKNPGNSGNYSLKDFIPRKELIVKFEEIGKRFKRVVFGDVCNANILRIEQKIDLTTGNLSEKMDMIQASLKEGLENIKEEIKNNKQ